MTNLRTWARFLLSANAVSRVLSGMPSALLICYQHDLKVLAGLLLCCFSAHLVYDRSVGNGFAG